MVHPIDLHVGQRLRQRRCLLGMTQQKLAESVGIKFQQIQKYEKGTNRVSASRLYKSAQALNEPLQYFLMAFRPKIRRCCNRALPKTRIRRHFLTSCSASREFN